MHYTTFTDLARAYHPYVEPRCARRHLIETLRRSSGLMSELERAGFRIGCRKLYPGHADIIIRYLGLPPQPPQKP